MSKPLSIVDLYGRTLPLWFLDFETYYNTKEKYSLRNMSTAQYVRDPRFKAHGLSYVDPEWNTGWITHKDLPDFFASIDWKNTAVGAHNASFDKFISSEIYKAVAAYYVCTMSMSRGEFGPGVKASLDALSKRLEQDEEKIQGELEKTDGIRDLSPEQEAALVPYAIRDSRLARKNFEVLYFDRGYPEQELHVIDLTIRAFVDPKLEIDAELCRQEIEDEDRRMAALLNSDLIGQAQLSDPCRKILLSEKGLTGLMRSRPCFAELLRSRGVEPPMKERKNAQGIVIEGEYTYAFAKNDIELITLGEDPRVSDLVATWCGLKSTIRKNKAQRFLDVTHNGTKPFAVPLLYCGGRTHRWSGAGADENDRATAGGYNVQNMSSGRDGGGKRLREAIKAPKGYVVVACDSAQVELRCSAWFAQEQDLLDALRTGGDPYAALASEIFGVPVAKETKDSPGINEPFRFVGKEGELSLQFGVGWKKFFNTVQTKYGFDSSMFSELDAQRTVDLYRAKRKGIVKVWNDLREFIMLMAAKEAGFDYKIFRFENNRVIMPNGLAIWYRDLHWYVDKENNQSGFIYRFKEEWTKIYAAKMYENFIQSIARSVVAEQALVIAQRYKIVLLVHDEVVYLAPGNEAQEALDFGLAAMRVAPSWAPGIPLDAEGKVGPRYLK